MAAKFLVAVILTLAICARGALPSDSVSLQWNRLFMKLLCTSRGIASERAPGDALLLPGAAFASPRSHGVQGGVSRPFEAAQGMACISLKRLLTFRHIFAGFGVRMFPVIVESDDRKAVGGSTLLPSDSTMIRNNNLSMETGRP